MSIKILVFALLLCPVTAMAQNSNAQPHNMTLVRADSFSFDTIAYNTPMQGMNVDRAKNGQMKGHVVMLINGKELQCDSALLLNGELTAYNFKVTNIKTQKPSQEYTVTGNHLKYKQNDKEAYLTGNLGLDVRDKDTGQNFHKIMGENTWGKLDVFGDKYVFSEWEYNTK